ncbi:SPIN4 protein, partial [Atractosteus spatula]|nr:SPIN4 protein [Atractosteus spatula]
MEIYKFSGAKKSNRKQTLFDILNHNFDLGLRNEQEKEYFQRVISLYVQRIINKKSRLRKSEREDFDRQIFALPLVRKESSEISAAEDAQQTASTSSACDIRSGTSELSDVKCTNEVVSELGTQFKNVHRIMEECRKLDDERARLDKKKKERGLMLYKAESEIKALSNKLSKANEKLGQGSVRNVNKRLRRRDSKIRTLEQKVVECEQTVILNELEKSELEKEKAQLEKSIDELQEQLEKLRYTKKKESQKVAYYKRKCDSEADLAHRVRDLNEEVQFWQGEYEGLKTEIDRIVSHNISMYEKGKYSDAVREAYMDLVANMGVSARKASQIVRLVLDKLVGIQVDRLPGESFCKYLVLEARQVSLQHLKEKLLQESNLTLATDGTTKYGHKYGTAGISFQDGSRMHLGLREQASGSAQCIFDTVREMVKDVVNSGSRDSDTTRSEKEIFCKITNLIGDRASTEKKFNEILAQYRTDILPEIVDGFDDLSETDKARIGVINELFCGLHLIDGLAHQANVTLSVWERMIFGGEKVGSVSLDWMHRTVGESGTVRLIRSVCKAIHERGCEKSGKSVQFRSFLLSQGKSDHVPLVPFKGNRINAMFHNAAGVYFLHAELLEFMHDIRNENKLIEAVFEDLSVGQFIAGCRALGIICKLVTEPLWKALGKKEHVLKMNARYRELVCKLKEWQADSSKLVRGEVRLFIDIEVHSGPVLQKLTEQRSPEFEDMTRQAVELILASFVKVCCRMVADHLEYGRYDEVSEEMFEKLDSAPKTNVSCERDFGIFDNLLKVKARATALAVEGMIMFKENRSWQWLEKLDSEKKAEVLSQARESVKEQRAVFCERMARIRDARLQTLREKKEKKIEKETRDIRTKEVLAVEIGKYGGLWNSEEEIDEQLRNLDEDKKLLAVTTQLKFRRFVIGMKNEKGVFNFSKDGKRLSLEQLIANLKSVVCRPEEIPGTSREEKDYCLAPSERIVEEKAEFLKEAVKQHFKARDLGRKKVGMERLRIPMLIKPEHLLGKRVRHAFDEKGRKVWYKGTVAEMRLDGQEYIFKIKYDGFRKMWWFDLWKDYMDSYLELLPVSAEDFVGKKVEHMFVSSEDGSECWWPGRVVNVNRTGDLFVVDYVEEGDDEVSGIIEYPLLDDYMNNEVRIVA